MRRYLYFLIFSLLLTTPAMAQVMATNAGFVYNTLSLNQTYYFDQVYNLKGSYTFSGAYYNANGCYCYSGKGYIRWSGAQWELGGAIGQASQGGCYYCTFLVGPYTVTTNTNVTTFSPPCTG